MTGNINVRLELWASFWRWKLGLDQAQSFEGQYRSPQREHWEPPVVRTHSIWTLQEIQDAEEIESAVCSLDIFHHTLLKSWYIRRRSDNYCLGQARKAAGEQSRTKGNFDACLAMAKALLLNALEEPAVVRKQRASAYVRKLLGLPALTTLPVAE